ncbi:MAG: HoxN/HupN/NixA family nickel/cobalt transporter [Propionibacteriaceae bacterium]|nr:HoxN/HupN/NixA family nickel/cobalt transporter [Propionibacteriaceae bacterium]
MVGFIVVLHVAGWGVLIALVGSGQLASGTGQVFGVGLGLTAYTLGMRHAFDADHIAAIDNTTRKQIAEGGRPVSVGFWFSLGHSTVVLVLVALLVLGVRSLASQLSDDSSALQQVTGVAGTVVSGVFLLLIGVVNLVVLVGIVGVFRRMRRGSFDEAELEEQLDNRGLANRLLRGATRAVTRPRHMYPVGLLFGLGFDTATEVGLLVIAAGAAVSLPWYAVLTLPVLFAAGMCLLDTLDGLFMRYAYGWANFRPVRKVYYNIAITGLSVAVALVIGGIELISVLADKLSIHSGPLAAIAALDLGDVGFLMTGLFVVAWLVAALIWKFGRIEERWSRG